MIGSGGGGGASTPSQASASGLTRLRTAAGPRFHDRGPFWRPLPAAHIGTPLPLEAECLVNNAAYRLVEFMSEVGYECHEMR